MFSNIAWVILGLIVLFAVLPFFKHLRSKHYGVTGTFRDVIEMLRKKL